MSDNWVVQNLEKALGIWNDKLSEIWQLITQSPTSFKGGTLWNVVSSIHGSLGRPLDMPCWCCSS